LWHHAQITWYTASRRRSQSATSTSPSPPNSTRDRQTIFSYRPRKASGWPGGVMVRALNRHSKGRGFNSRPFSFQVTTLGKLFTHMCSASSQYDQTLSKAHRIIMWHAADILNRILGRDVARRYHYSSNLLSDTDLAAGARRTAAPAPRAGHVPSTRSRDPARRQVRASRGRTGKRNVPPNVRILHQVSLGSPGLAVATK